MNLSETNGPIEIKFYLKHHWGGGKAALLGFGPDWIFILADKEENHYISEELEFRPNSTKDCGVSCP